MTQVRHGAYEEIRLALREQQPNLHLHVSASGAVIRGSFAVRGPDGSEIDRYQVSIEILSDFPHSLPVVREVGGRIPWNEDFHVERNGRACVLLPDARWQCFPLGAPFSAYLQGPLHNYFLGQTVHAETGKWPFGEWGHGKYGMYEYYKEILGTQDEATIRRFVQVLAKMDMNRGQACPCGSGQKVKRCCVARVVDLRRKIPREVAALSLSRLQNPELSGVKGE